MTKKKTFARKRKREIVQNCYFCENRLIPDYKDIGALATFLTPRGKIVARRRTGICAKHQRKLSSTVKRARIMAMA